MLWWFLWLMVILRIKHTHGGNGWKREREKMEPCTKNRATRQKSPSQKAQHGPCPTNTAPCWAPAENHPVQVTGHGPCSADTPPCPGFCFNSVIFVTGTWPRGRARSTRGRVQLLFPSYFCFLVPRLSCGLLSDAYGSILKRLQLHLWWGWL